MQYHVTDDEITKLVREKCADDTEITTTAGLFYDADDPDGAYTVMGAFSESNTPAYRAYLAGFGLVVDHENNMMTFTDNKDVLDVMRHIAHLVHLEYDNIDDVPQLMWKLFDLGGDDDVDYFGGYINAVADAIELWIDAHPA